MLEISKLSYYYKSSKAPALKQISAQFNEGEVTAIVGPSGSGKTTLLSLLAGLDKPQSGVILVHGKPLLEQDVDQYRREQVAMIFQAYNLFPNLTVMENACIPLELLGHKKSEAREVAASILMSLGINEEKHDRFPSSLSGGEQQRVAIARCLSSGAKIILADEPTGNLDKANTRNILHILQELAHRRKYCVLIVTHDMDVADEADRVFTMEAGNLCESVQDQER